MTEHITNKDSVSDAVIPRKRPRRDVDKDAAETEPDERIKRRRIAEDSRGETQRKRPRRDDQTEDSSLHNNQRKRQRIAEIRAEIDEDFVALFGDSPMVSQSRSLAACSTYWDTKHYIEAHALETGLRSSFGPMGFEGLARNKRIGADFNSCVKEWQSHQSRVFRMFINVLVKRILGRDVDCCLESVMLENGWTKIDAEVMMLAYRGSGKTWLLSAAIASLIANIPGLTICAYAGTKEKTIDFFENIYMYYEGLCERHQSRGEEYSVHKVKNKLFVYYNRTDIRWIKAFSTHGFVRKFFSHAPFSSFFLLRQFDHKGHTPLLASNLPSLPSPPSPDLKQFRAYPVLIIFSLCFFFCTLLYHKQIMNSSIFST